MSCMDQRCPSSFFELDRLWIWLSLCNDTVLYSFYEWQGSKMSFFVSESGCLCPPTLWYTLVTHDWQRWKMSFFLLCAFFCIRLSLFNNTVIYSVIFMIGKLLGSKRSFFDSFFALVYLVVFIGQQHYGMLYLWVTHGGSKMYFFFLCACIFIWWSLSINNPSADRSTINSVFGSSYHKPHLFSEVSTSPAIEKRV